ncbi:hypothetical protein M5K25_020937 [Dendrobium thyrsiflorum]|uniref:Uncharacterized protein n=1 Tax=Dendrobium thyrsiflorum TaxID=117978 RepID=A0ABD0UBA4_DENTH
MVSPSNGTTPMVLPPNGTVGKRLRPGPSEPDGLPPNGTIILRSWSSPVLSGQQTTVRSEVVQVFGIVPRSLTLLLVAVSGRRLQTSLVKLNRKKSVDGRQYTSVPVECVLRWTRSANRGFDQALQSNKKAVPNEALEEIDDNKIIQKPTPKSWTMMNEKRRYPNSHHDSTLTTREWERPTGKHSIPNQFSGQQSSINAHGNISPKAQDSREPRSQEASPNQTTQIPNSGVRKVTMVYDLPSNSQKYKQALYVKSTCANKTKVRNSTSKVCNIKELMLDTLLILKQ